jgi:hypothetical protein
MSSVATVCSKQQHTHTTKNSPIYRSEMAQLRNQYSPAVKRCLLNESTLIHDTYCMTFDAVMSSLASS